MIYDVSHKTTINYDGIVRLAEFNLRMRPVDWPDQEVISQDLSITPPARTFNRDGAYLAPITRARLDTPLRELVISKHFRIRITREAPEPQSGDPTVGEIRKAALSHQGLEVLAPANYLYPSPRVPLDGAIADWCAPDLAAGRGIVEAGLALARRIKASFDYDSKATEADTPVSEAFAAKAGVCQDFAHIMLVGLRAAGLPAAYVSGYLRTVPPAGKPRLVGADATHAWVMIWCGETLGWLGIDPTNGCTVGDGHILVALGRDYTDVSPIDGVLLGLTKQKLKVAVDVIPVDGV
jgi:transglutaminase-like putative cysteine protease